MRTIISTKRNKDSDLKYNISEPADKAGLFCYVGMTLKTIIEFSEHFKILFF